MLQLRTAGGMADTNFIVVCIPNQGPASQDVHEIVEFDKGFLEGRELRNALTSQVPPGASLYEEHTNVLLTDTCLVPKSTKQLVSMIKVVL